MCEERSSAGTNTWREDTARAMGGLERPYERTRNGVQVHRRRAARVDREEPPPRAGEGGRARGLLLGLPALRWLRAAGHHTCVAAGVLNHGRRGEAKGERFAQHLPARADARPSARVWLHEHALG